MGKNFFKLLDNFDIVINATSLGLDSGENFKFKLTNFKKTLIYIDTIYNPKQTKLIQYFKSKNVRTFNGLHMLIYQGQKSFYLWNKINPEIDDDLLNYWSQKLN